MIAKDIFKVQKALAQQDEFYEENKYIFEEIVKLLNATSLDLKLIKK